ncbi:hypothetical protein BSKO_07113 [Bryopsis sp. KO-2023]|nr:hypothetical protein BSKO_07113 [Bryopsis sp. KO-2023]
MASSPKKKRTRSTPGSQWPIRIVLVFLGGVGGAIMTSSFLTGTHSMRSREENVAADALQLIPLTRKTKAMHMLSDATVVFIHLPKAGGASLLEFWFGNLRSLGCTALPPGDSAVDLYNGLKREEDLLPDEEPCTMMHTIGVPKLLPKLLTEHQLKLRSVFGHVPFGMCNFLESPCTYATVVRHPVDRLMSHYYHLKQMGIETAIPCNCTTFEEFVHAAYEGDVWEIRDQFPHWHDNLQTRMILGDGYVEDVLGLPVCHSKLQGCDRRGFRKLTQADLDQAKENLSNHFSVVGILEEVGVFGETMVELHGFISAKIAHSHKTQARDKRVADLSEDVYKKIVEMEKWDMILYEYVKSIRRMP